MTARTWQVWVRDAEDALMVRRPSGNGFDVLLADRHGVYVSGDLQQLPADAVPVVLVSPQDAPEEVCGDTTGPNGVGGPCVLPPRHPHVDGIGGSWTAVPKE